MALDEVTDRLERICAVLHEAGIPYALVGGQAVAVWVATRDPAAVRTTKDVDLLLARADLSRARAAAQAAGFDYFEVLGVGMFLDRRNPNPRAGVHLVWSGERVRPEHPFPAPSVEQRERVAGAFDVVSLDGLVQMKVQAGRDQDRVHLRDLIDVGLVDRSLLDRLPPALAARLEPLLTELGR